MQGMEGLELMLEYQHSGIYKYGLKLLFVESHV